jgi:hypothetical protein
MTVLDWIDLLGIVFFAGVFTIVIVFLGILWTHNRGGP